MKNILQLIIFILPFMIFGQNKENVIINFCDTDRYIEEKNKKYPQNKVKLYELDSILNDIKDSKIKITNYEDTTLIDTLNSKSKSKYRTEFTTEVIPWVVRIPVVVHIVYKNEIENISDAQIQSQINALNQHFRRLNSSAANTPASFVGLARDARIEFCLATIDPNGNPTNGITRTSTTIQKFNSDDLVKYDNTGGKSIWNRNNYLNIWVCDYNGGGYAQFPAAYAPSGSNTAAETDGVVMTYNYFGTLGTATLTGYTQGTITVHEVGHWLGLYHIFGNGSRNDCADDGVADTPLQVASQFNCSTFPKVSCNNGPNGGMFMNYMDYSNGDCMNMFTAGQRDRMMGAIFVARNTFSTFNNISVNSNPIQTDNYGATKSITSSGKIYSGSTVNFRAGDIIKLENGFKAQQGSIFRAKINECVCSGTITNITQHTPYRKESSTSTSDSTKINSEQKHTKLIVYPNPVSNKTTNIDYMVNKKGFVRLYMTNSLGMHLKDLVYDYNHANGKHTLSVNLNGYAQGVYYIRYYDFEKSEVTKLIIE